MDNRKKNGKEPNSKITLMSVTYDLDKNNYTVSLAKGSNVAEAAFGMSIIIKCLVRDKVIEKPDEILTLIKKYLDDPQYEELKENEQH